MWTPILYVLAGCVQLRGYVAVARDVITEDVIFYGQSPPVYPSPNASGLGDWNEAYTKAKNLLAQLTIEEKVNLTGGFSGGNLCSGNIYAIPRLNFPGLCLSDGPAGLRGTNYVSSWPAGLSVGASWNRNLTRRRGIGMAGEFKAKGVQVALGPVVGPLGRIASGGRNWEGFSNDPYLAGALAYDTVQGMQSVGVTTSTKHFIANEQETNRNPDSSTNTSAVSSNIDDTTMHELYLWPFQDTVKAGTGSIMCSYERINNSYGCSNSKTQNGLLKTELGFQGFIVSDWGAQHAGVATALAGLDMVMPQASAYWGANLTEAVNNGSVPLSRLDDMAIRVLATWFRQGQDVDFPPTGYGMPSSLAEPHERVIGTSSYFKGVLFQGAVEGHVLLKNEREALPLKSPRLISLFGYSARSFDRYTWNSPGWNVGDKPLSPGEYARYWDDSLPGPLSQIASNGTLPTGGGSGANQPAYLSSTFEALSQRAYDDGTHLWWDFQFDNSSGIDQSSDACIVDVNAFATEGNDRPGLHDDYTDNLILSVASQCNNTIVVFHNAGVRLVDQFIDHPNVTALIFAHVPGQDSGRALASILYGDVSPSGKLPYSVPHNESDYGVLADATQPEGEYVLFPQSDFSEGIFIDYRAFEKQNITPRYEFGFGLSYAKFEYSNLRFSTSENSTIESYPSGEVLEGGRIDLWDVVVVVSADITNTGSVSGDEVAQLYLYIPNRPVKQLRGFAKVATTPGQSATVSFNLTRRDLSIWDTVAQEWLLQRGEYQIFAGSSSKDSSLAATVTL
ncbi:putative Beta-glucosidase [Seiridium cardinale]